MTRFVKWIIIFSLISLGLGASAYYGILIKINEADFTKISFVILALFVGLSLRIGVSLYRSDYVSIELSESISFFAEFFTKLGFIGTIAGFIFALYHTFAGINIADMAATQNALVSMAVGMGTALYTTICGLVCSLLLRIYDHVL